jgi:hypothetical protein
MLVVECKMALTVYRDICRVLQGMKEVVQRPKWTRSFMRLGRQILVAVRTLEMAMGNLLT